MSAIDNGGQGTMTTDTHKPDSTELVTIPVETALDVFTDPAKLDGVLQQIRAKVDAFVPDLSTAAGRDRVKSFAFKISQSKTYLDGLAQKEYQAASEVPKKISKARQTITATLDKWRDEARKPVTEWENQEKARVAAHTAAVGQIARRGNAEGQTSAQLRATIAELEAMQFSAAQCEEFLESYENARTRALSGLRPMLSLREQYERDQAELARLRDEAKARQAEEAKARETAMRATAAEDAKAAAAKRDADLQAQIAALAAVAEEPENDLPSPDVVTRAPVPPSPRPMHPNVARAFDEIDAALFSGDTFHNPQSLARLKSMIERWQRAIPSIEARISATSAAA